MIAPFVDVAWLRAQRGEVLLADCRFYLDGRSPRQAYDQGHLPGAVFIDLHRWLAAGDGAPDQGRHPLPEPGDFARAMGAAGIGDGTPVVAYDDAGGVMAARLVWMLRATGHDAALLDGGLAAWDGPLETGEVVPPPATFAPVPWPPERLASIDDAEDPANVVLDARPRERYLGGADELDPRAGHIPGARSLPVREHLDESGRLLPVEALRERLADVGVEASASVVSYCGSGVTACHNLLVLEHAGYPAGRLYPGSWSQYSRSERPLETGDPAR